MTSCIIIDVFQFFRGTCRRRHHHHYHKFIHLCTRRHFPGDTILHSRSLGKVHPREGHEGPEGNGDITRLYL